MNRLMLKDFRCFHEEQTARLAPLTLLVGENSTGKTSFMAMIRALWDVAYAHRAPDFKEEPYDLGSFDEIAHHRGKSGRADMFEAGFSFFPGRSDAARGKEPVLFSTRFEKRGTAPFPVQRNLAHGKSWIEEYTGDQTRKTRIGTSRGTWMYSDDSRIPRSVFDRRYEMLPPFPLFRRLASTRGEDFVNRIVSCDGSPDIIQEDLDQISELVSPVSRYNQPWTRRRPYASAPVRSRPRRTYDPARLETDPEGDYIPMYLANIYFQNKTEWAFLKAALENFGRASGLFDEIAIRQLGKRESEPFQVQIRKFSKRLKGPHRNVIDVGYGVSQVLSLITELFRRNAPDIFLLQQPEVHLHPSAQAALGSLLCEIAAGNRQLVIETHSDHLLDRIRMDVRDGEAGSLKPGDVSILYFEHGNLDVRIHSLRLDEQGNIQDAPESYRRFFMEETQRSLGLF